MSLDPTKNTSSQSPHFDLSASTISDYLEKGWLGKTITLIFLSIIHLEIINENSLYEIVEKHGNDKAYLEKIYITANNILHATPANSKKPTSFIDPNFLEDGLEEINLESENLNVQKNYNNSHVLAQKIEALAKQKLVPDFTENAFTFDDEKEDEDTI